MIDVNSGKTAAKARSKADIEAGAESQSGSGKRGTARQIRLRNLSGIILIDFINLSDAESTARLLSEFRSHLAKDPIQATLVDMTALGLWKSHAKR